MQNFATFVKQTKNRIMKVPHKARLISVGDEVELALIHEGKRKLVDVYFADSIDDYFTFDGRDINCNLMPYEVTEIHIGDGVSDPELTEGSEGFEEWANLICDIIHEMKDEVAAYTRAGKESRERENEDHANWQQDEIDWINRNVL